jgi:hypothetical protein
LTDVQLVGRADETSRGDDFQEGSGQFNVHAENP